MQALCPLCGCREAKQSWLGLCTYEGETFEYVRCVGCCSLHCHPMPGPRILAAMYGPDYAAFSDPDIGGIDARLGTALDVLRLRQPGRFIDYGCGGGDLIRGAAQLGWDCAGIEFSREIAARLTAELGVRVVTPDDCGRTEQPADVICLNDVIEHLTDLPVRFPRILELMAHDGVLVAQGPLEGNPNLFMHAVAASRRIGPGRVSAMPPYHVILATAGGQRTFFRRSGLRELRFDVTETAWPAPAHLSRPVVRDPRALGLYSLRKASQGLGRLVRGYSGNRYMYVGQR